MTRDQYFEMCEALGTEPVEEEIPVEMEDFPTEVQEAIGVYYKLRDEWDTFNGNYMGKSYVGLSDIFDILDIEKKDRKFILEWISVMDSTRHKIINDQKPKSD
jgi:hypothetical protein